MKHDIVIVGGGVPGLTLALALAQSTSLSVAVLEARDCVRLFKRDARVSAITQASKRIFKKLGVWSAIHAQAIQSFTRIECWDEAGNEIDFHCETLAMSALGYIVENQAIQFVLQEALQSYCTAQIFYSTKLIALHEKEDAIMLSTDTGQVFHAKLVVAADGAMSFVRERAQIILDKKDYNEEAIVATITTTAMHEQIARQCFLKTGPVALLPLSDSYRTSLVWTLPTAEAKQYMDLKPDDFCKALTCVFSKRFSEVVVVEGRQSFRLCKQQAQQCVKPRIALLGDALHTVHPLAGQGMNMGLLDAAALFEIIHTAIAHHRDFGSHAVLRRYARWRKADNFPMSVGIDWIKQLFAANTPVISLVRVSGLQILNRFPTIKNYFARYAVGERNGLPKLAQ
ncbi:MAG: hypothetical protein A3F43_01695 [Gammaproteobacteria bacterium RIFCSPHIGHO2_12_FULL_42_10]|nr:MAG: hypothetical protein A3F43_01695 [Gammaproteobacteria bacterium RIFCSPHIGHO2_12_FULL_42_10]